MDCEMGKFDIVQGCCRIKSEEINAGTCIKEERFTDPSNKEEEFAYVATGVCEPVLNNEINYVRKEGDQCMTGSTSRGKKRQKSTERAAAPKRKEAIHHIYVSSVNLQAGVNVRSKSSVASFFELPSNIDEKTSFKVKCKECGTEITGHGKTTSSFVKHVKRKHEALLNQRTAEQPKKSPSQLSTGFCKTAVAITYKPSDPHQAEITDALIKFMSQDLMSLSLFESESFKQLLHTLDPRYHLPDRKTFSRELLHAKCESITTRIQSQLKQAKNVALTIDLWSSHQMRGFIGITAHFILDWSLKSVALVCKRFRGSHTAANVYNQYLDVITTYHIADKITHVTTDSATNMVTASNGEQCALSLPGYEKAEPSAYDTDSDTESDLDYFRAECSSDPLDCPSDGPTDNSCDPMACLPVHDPCFTCILQNTIKDGLHAVVPISNTIRKASIIVSYVRKSTLASDHLKQYTSLHGNNATSWNGQLKMIRSILAIPDSDLDQIDAPPKFSDYDRSVLKDLVEILNPFEEATDKLQGQNIVTSSLVVPVVRGLRTTVQTLQSKYNCGLLAALKSSVETRLALYEDKPHFLLASVLDPRYKVDWCSSQKEIESMTETLIIRAAEKDPKVSSFLNTNASSHTKRCKLFGFMNKSPAGASHRPISPVSQEVINYLAIPTIPEDDDPLDFWKQNHNLYPILSQLAEDHLCLPASSAPVERLFNIGGEIFRPERYWLTDHTFENLMMIRCNSTQ